MDAIEPLAARVPYMVQVGNHEYGAHHPCKLSRGMRALCRVPARSPGGSAGCQLVQAHRSLACLPPCVPAFGGPRRTAVTNRLVYSAVPAGYDKGSAIDPSGGKPYAPSWGNYGADSGGECGVMLARRFMMPASARADNPPFWYGFDYGSVHFTAISTEHDLQPGSPQYAWLEAELAAVDRCRTPWLVLLLHRPMYGECGAF